MSFAEVQQSITKMTIEERLDIAALIVHLNRMDDSEFQADLDRRMTAMDNGHKHSGQTLKDRPVMINGGLSSRQPPI